MDAVVGIGNGLQGINLGSQLLGKMLSLLKGFISKK
jgi:hypothetical protein